MTDYTHCGRCNLGAIYSHDHSHLVIVVADSGEVLGADADGDFSRFWFNDDGELVDGDTDTAHAIR